MIHNKYFEVLKQFLGDFRREIYGRELVGKVKLSQKGIALALEELEKKSILKSRKEGNLKHYGLNFAHSEIKAVISVAELTRKIEFLAKNRKIAHIFRSDERIMGIFGSYAKNAQKESSDLDVFIIGPKKDDYYSKECRKMDIGISIKYFSRAEWISLLKEKNNLCKEIINNHVLIFGIEQFLELLWGNYYGFN